MSKLEATLLPSQRKIYGSILDEARKLDVDGGKIKTTVANLRRLNSIRKRINAIVLNKKYAADVKEFAKAFNEVTTLQNQYWQAIEPEFKPRPLLKQVRLQAIDDTVRGLAGNGIGANVQEPIIQVLRSNITTGGSYAKMTQQLSNLINESNTPGLLQRYVRQVATDSINQYNAQYTQIVSSDLGFEWFYWAGTEIMTSRPFCQAMVENHPYFHISSVPKLLQGRDETGAKLQYKDNETNNLRTVEINPKTNLPAGFIDGTNAANFFVNRGGYNCGHQARPTSEQLVKSQAPKLYEQIINSAAYKAYKRSVTA